MRVLLAALAFLALCAGCGSQRNTLDRLWHGSGQAVALIPGTSDYAPGDVRVSFLVVAKNGRVVERPTATVWLSHARSDVPFEQTTARLEPIGVPGKTTNDEASTIYVAHVHVARPGTYWLLARPDGGSLRIGGIHDIGVKAQSVTPAVGARAYPSQTPTLGTAPLRLLTTASPPDVALLRYSIAGSLRAHVPFVVTFATPRWCSSRTCGPVVDVVNSVRAQLGSRRGIRFIHVEIYRDNNPSRGTNQWVQQWHLASEPWVFLVGRDGRIKAKFEGSVSQAELRDAVLRLLL